MEHHGRHAFTTLEFSFIVQIPEVLSGNVSHITRTSVVFSWNKIPDSEKSYGKITGYKIIIHRENHRSRNMTVPKNESTIELRDLVPGNGYNLTVIGFNSYGEGLVRDVFGFRTRCKRCIFQKDT